MRISDWSSDVCSSDLVLALLIASIRRPAMASRDLAPEIVTLEDDVHHAADRIRAVDRRGTVEQHFHPIDCGDRYREDIDGRSEERTSELQSLMRISYAVCCLKQKT